MIKVYPEDSSLYKQLTTGEDDQTVLVKYLISLYHQNKHRIFEETILAEGEHTVTAEYT